MEALPSAIITVSCEPLRFSAPTGSRDMVYIILRGFNSAQERIGMRVYVDPVELEASGQLVLRRVNGLRFLGLRLDEEVS